MAQHSASAAAVVVNILLAALMTSSVVAYPVHATELTNSALNKDFVENRGNQWRAESGGWTNKITYVENVTVRCSYSYRVWRTGSMSIDVSLVEINRRTNDKPRKGSVQMCHQQQSFENHRTLSRLSRTQHNSALLVDINIAELVRLAIHRFD